MRLFILLALLVLTTACETCDLPGVNVSPFCHKAMLSK